jgi:ribosomal protein L1
MDTTDRRCCLTLDEMEISGSVDYDASSKQVLGDVTLPNDSGSATHLLAFMLGGSIVS